MSKHSVVKPGKKKVFKGFRHSTTFSCKMCHLPRRRSGGDFKDKDGNVIGYACFRCAIKQIRRENAIKRADQEGGGKKVSNAGAEAPGAGAE